MNDGSIGASMLDDVELTPEQAREIDSYCLAAQKAAEEHLEACDEALHMADLAGADLEALEKIENPALGPYCGCQICVVRETLFAAWPHMEKAVLIEWSLWTNKNQSSE